MTPKYNRVVIHYGEIGTKGKNREVFERKLLSNVSRVLRSEVKRVYRRYGRIVAELSGDEDLERIKEKLRWVPGIEYFSFARSVGLKMEEIEKVVVEILKVHSFTSFKINTKRSNKEFPLTSMEVNRRVGETVIKILGKKVNVIRPDVMVWIEICEKEAFVYTEKNKGIGGLPTTTGGKLISLLSGGIDSPVASFLMMKRGCKIIFTHFFNQTLVTKASLRKVEKIVKELTKVQLDSKLYLVPFSEIQKEIIKNVPSNYRMLIYRRFMMRISNRIAEMEKAKGIVTGDSVGQVASQTLENLRCIYEVAKLPVFSPLVGMNKEEIVELAKRIGTYQLSILPYPDCCSFMISPHPKTKASLKKVIELENLIPEKERLIEHCLSRLETKTFSFP